MRRYLRGAYGKWTDRGRIEGAKRRYLRGAYGKGTQRQRDTEGTQRGP